MPAGFPFSAIVGQEALRTALLLNAVDPSLGGVLVRGEKGTGKSSAARALASILPGLQAVKGCAYRCDPADRRAWCSDCRARFAEGGRPEILELPTPWVELPLNATEDRLAGSIKIEAALARGRLEFEPGLLAAANRGAIYVDEVNLLEDHLVDLLLDAAASGLQRVEREGLSLIHPAGFFLIGSMNPEEGELRPQFIDRFGLCVSVKSLADRGERLAIARRRLDFEADPGAFNRKWEPEDELLRAGILRARRALLEVEVPDSIWNKAVELAERARAQGHRAEILMVKAARALAALMEKSKAGPAELLEAARLVLPHRINPAGLRSPERAGDEIDRLLAGLAIQPDGGAKPPAAPAPESMETGRDDQLELDPDFYEGMQVPGATAAGSLLFSFIKKKALSLKA